MERILVQILNVLITDRLIDAQARPALMRLCG